MSDRENHVRDYVKHLIKAFLRVGSLHSVDSLERSSKLFSRLFSRKEMLSFSVSVSNALAIWIQIVLSSTSSCALSTWGGCHEF